MKRTEPLHIVPKPEPEPELLPKAPPAHPFAALEARVLNVRGEVLKEFDARVWAKYGLEEVKP